MEGELEDLFGCNSTVRNKEGVANYYITIIWEAEEGKAVESRSLRPA